MARPKKLPDGMKQRGKTYYAWFTAHGRQFRKSLSKDFDTACIMLNDMRAKADREDYGIITNDYPWEKLKQQYLQWAQQSLKTPRGNVTDIATIERYMKPSNVRQITPQFVIGFREWRIGQGRRRKNRKGVEIFGRPITMRTINKEVGTLRAMLNKGVEWKKIGNNPIATVKALRHDNPSKQRRPLTVDEVQRLFAASPEWLRPVWRMFLTTGIRREELAGLLFEDIDFERKLVIIRANRSKNHKAREIPLDDEMISLIARLRDEAPFRRPMPGPGRRQTEMQTALFSKDHVFVTTVNTPLTFCCLKKFYACCKRAGIEDAVRNGSVDLHSLRVTFASLAIENGANPKAVQSILGHSTLTLTMNIYAKTSEQAKRDTIGKLPFANVSDPGHILRFKAHKSGSSNSDETQGIAAVSG